MDIFFVASIIGGFAFALSGFLVGVRKDLDVMGVFILSFLTANGGGVLRDVMIGRVPLVLNDLSGVSVVILAFLFGFGLLKLRKWDVEKRSLFVLSDSIGLAAFSITGALAGVTAGLSLFGVVVLAFITATGGGILRDSLIGDVPSVFKSDFYGSVAVVVALGIYALDHFGYAQDVNILGVFVLALLLRLVAFKMGWSLPRLKIR